MGKKVLAETVQIFFASLAVEREQLLKSEGTHKRHDGVSQSTCGRERVIRLNKKKNKKKNRREETGEVGLYTRRKEETWFWVHTWPKGEQWKTKKASK